MDYPNWLIIAMARPELVVPPLIFYCFFFWGMPMLGSWNTSDRPRNTLLPYWKCVRQISGLFRIAAVVVTGIMWVLWPYLMAPVQ